MTHTVDMTFTKVEAGWYATPDGRWGVVSEGHGYVNAAGRALGAGNDGWALVYNGGRHDHQEGETLGWYDTKREAVEAANREARNRQRQAANEALASVQGGGSGVTPDPLH